MEHNDITLFQNNFQFPRAYTVINEEPEKRTIEHVEELFEFEEQEIDQNEVCQQIITATEIPKVSESSSKLFTDGNQIYEIQFIEFPRQL